MATICTTVFHLARRVTGTPTASEPRNSRKPETRTSRQRMMTPAHSDQPAMVWSAASISSAADPMSLSAMGSSTRATAVALLLAGAGEIAVEEITDAGGDEDPHGRPAAPIALDEKAGDERRNGD